MPAARALSSPSGEAAEDNVEEKENSEVMQCLVTGYGYGRTDVPTDGRMDRETCQLTYYFRCLNHLKIRSKSMSRADFQEKN